MEEIYFDNASTTKVFPEVAEEIFRHLSDAYANPSSLHRLGEFSSQSLQKARNSIASVLSVDKSEIIFTSGGTEGNNIAIKGFLKAAKRKGMHCITTRIEHPSVLNSFKEFEQKGWEVSFLDVDQKGNIDLAQLKKILRKDTVLVSIQHINNEIGSIQPIKEIGQLLSKSTSRPAFHVDAVQSFCKYSIKPHEMGIQMLTLSAHKIHGAKGSGALFVKKGFKLHPLFSGGEQEMGLRAGTENLPGIVGIEKAIEIMGEDIFRNNLYLSKLKKMFYENLKIEIPSIELIGPEIENGACNILNIAFRGLPAEVLQRSLSVRGVHVGIGAACSPRRKTKSHVLTSLGLDNSLVRSALRISFSLMNTEKQVQNSIQVIKDTHIQLSRFI